MEKKAELTVKSIIIGIVLAILLCGANIYLGLKIGSTISASIPAAIISLGILKMFKKYTVLENSISQTIASAGEAIVNSIIFVFPALLMLGVWDTFPYWMLVVLGLCGAFVGIAYSVLLRKILLRDKSLPFPEGNAIGKVLLTANNTGKSSDFKIILRAMVVSGAINFLQNGFQVLAGSYYKFIKIGKSFVGMGTAFSPAIIGSGFLIGSNAVVGFISLLFGWLILLPYFSIHVHLKTGSDIVSSSFFVWKNYVRPVGIGVFLFSGIATILLLWKQIIYAVKDAFRALKNLDAVSETDKDLDIKKMLSLVLICFIPIAFILYDLFSNITGGDQFHTVLYTIIVTLIVFVLGFIITAVAGYMVGLVGSSNSPMSGIIFIAIIILGLFLKSIIPVGHSTNMVIAIVLFMSGFILFSAAIINDNIQDYKSGQIVGSTPYKQQISLFFGAFFAMLIAPVMMNFIFQAYGISGIPAPHAHMNPANMLSAPQASAIAMITKNILQGSAEWHLIIFGGLIGLSVFILDLIAKKYAKFRIQVLMVGMGLYLPPEIVTGLFIGGILSILIKRKFKKLELQSGADEINKLDNKTNILICGLIAGESLMGLFLSVPFVIKQSSDALKIVGPGFIGTSQILSAIVTIAMVIFIYRFATKIKK